MISVVITHDMLYVGKNMNNDDKRHGDVVLLIGLVVIAVMAR